MSTYRMMAVRLVRLAVAAAGKMIGRGPLLAAHVRSVPRTLARLPPLRFGGPPRGLLVRQVWRAMRGGGYANVRAASAGLWLRGGRLRRRRAPSLGLANILATSASPGVTERIRTLFADHCRFREATARRESGAYPRSVAGYDVGRFIDMGANAAVYEARVRTPTGALRRDRRRRPDYPLALKMVLRVDFADTADSWLWGQMGAELVPLADRQVQHNLDRWRARRLRQAVNEPLACRNIQQATKTHPNVVRMHTAFLDEIPRLRGDSQLFPAAIPPPDDCNRRPQTLFLVMQRYRMTLYEYLNLAENIDGAAQDTRVGQVLFAQLLEALVFLHDQRIVHRDMKSDNILVDFDGPRETPALVLTDFGCCLSSGEMEQPYASENTDLGGNVAMRAPEVRCARPAPHRRVNFGKADLWAAGALAFEIFTRHNPFYASLSSKVYAEQDLPALPAAVPSPLRRLVGQMLRRDPAQRPEVDCAATVAALTLTRVRDWLSLVRDMGKGGLMLGALALDEGVAAVDEALSLYAAESVLAERLERRLAPAEVQLRKTFLARVHLQVAVDATALFSDD